MIEKMNPKILGIIMSDGSGVLHDSFCYCRRDDDFVVGIINYGRLY